MEGANTSSAGPPGFHLGPGDDSSDPGLCVTSWTLGCADHRSKLPKHDRTNIPSKARAEVYILRCHRRCGPAEGNLNRAGQGRVFRDPKLRAASRLEAVEAPAPLPTSPFFMGVVGRDTVLAHLLGYKPRAVTRMLQL